MIHFRRNDNYKSSSCGDQGDDNYRCTWRAVNCFECLQAVHISKAEELKQIRERLEDVCREQRNRTQTFLRKHVGNPQSDETTGLLQNGVK